MRQSKLFTKTKKQVPKDEKSINAILLERAGFVYKEMAGVYSFLPLGLRVLKKIEEIVREEINKISGQEVSMAVLQPKKLWQETGRWSEGIGKSVMYKCQGDGKIGLGPTHEEMLTDIIRNYVQSFEDLPVYIYQIQTKFRKEARARSGLLRGREFVMKDLYSFHSSESDFKEYYEKVKKTYLKIFKRCELETIITEASGAGFTKEHTHEFQVLAQEGEDKIVHCPKLHFSQNKEISKFKRGDKCPLCKETLKESKSIEVGNIFPLGTKYSEAMKAFFTDKDMKRKPIIMGCYGIGISRVMGAVVEIHHDQKGIIWPSQVSPFEIHLIPLGSSEKRISRKIRQTGEKLYNHLKNSGIELLYDDREDKSSGEKFADADLIGIPIRIVVSERTLEKNSVELKKRSQAEMSLVKIKDIVRELKYYV
jgi:prolyl-tRNA synthetase